MAPPLVSIILTSYNQPLLLERAFDSLIHQSYENIEIIIVDDCSRDEGNRVLIEQRKQEHPGKVSAFYQTKNVGIPANKNTGFRLAKGDYISYLDGDDTYYKNKIATEIETFQKHPDVDVVYSNFDIKNLNGELLSVWSSSPRPEGYIFKEMILNKFPDCHAHRFELFKRHVLYDLNFYDEQFSIYHDLDLILRYSLKYKVAYNNHIVSSYYKNPGSIVSNSTGLQLTEQQEKVYAKYVDAVQENRIEAPFRKYMTKLELNKLFYLDHPDYAKLFRYFLKKPGQLIQLLRIANYLHKKKSELLK
jgi:glycosyltransferase involved in cell wall biosynthesis